MVRQIKIFREKYKCHNCCVYTCDLCIAVFIHLIYILPNTMFKTRILKVTRSMGISHMLAVFNFDFYSINHIAT